jgi:hypothetical protein
MRQFTGSRFGPNQRGEADIQGTFQGHFASLHVVVRDHQSYPFLEINVPVPGQAPTVRVRTAPNTSTQAMNDDVTWTSSDERFVTVPRTNLYRPTIHAPGNAQITATYGGLSDAYWISAPPRSH